MLFWEKDIWQTSRFLVAQLIKSMSVVQETWVRSLGREDSPGGGHGIPLQYSHLENPHGQRSLVGYSHEVAKSRTQLSDKAQVLILRLKTVMFWLSCLLTKQVSTRFSGIMFKTKLAIP